MVKMKKELADNETLKAKVADILNKLRAEGKKAINATDPDCTKIHGRQGSHAGGSPWNGRSALDAVEALNHMANMMREHISPSARMHYYISSGGQATNVVPDYAEVKYTVRSHNTNELNDISERIRKAAQGAAMGTGTTVECEERKGCITSLLSKSLSQLAHKNMKELPPAQVYRKTKSLY